MATERIIIEVQGRGFKTVSRNVRDLGRNAKRSTAILQQMRNALVVVAAARVIQRFTTLADGFVNLRNRLQATLGSFEAAREAQERIVAIARETRTSVDATGDAFARFALTTKGTGISTERLFGITKTLNQALILAGTTSQEARNGLIQLSQGIASNRLSGDELRAVLEQLPPVSIAIADSLGVTVGQLRKLGEEGKITAKVVLEALESIAAQTEKDFEDAVVTIDQALTSVGNELQVFIDNIFNATGAANSLADAVQGVAVGLKFLGENVGLTIGLLSSIGVLIGAKLISNLFKFATGFKTIRTAMRLAGRQAGITAKAVGFLTVAMRGLNAAILANPWGIAVAGISVLIGLVAGLSAETESFAEHQREVAAVLETTKEALDEDTIATSNQSAALLRNTFEARQNAIAKLQQAEAQLIANDALSDFASVGAENPAAAKVAELREEIRVLTLRMGDLQNRTEQLRNEEEKAANSRADSTEESKKATNVIKKLEFQIAQLGRTEREAAIAQALFNAGLEFGATGATADKIRELAGRYFDLLESLKLVEEQQELNDKLAKERIDLINDLKNSIKSRAEVEEEVGTKVEAIRGALIKAGIEEAQVDRLLAKTKKDLVDAQREEIRPELVKFLEENRTAREQLTQAEKDAAELKQQAIDDGFSAARANEIEAESIRKTTEAILANTTARQLNDRFFTSERTGREFADIQRELRLEQEQGLITQARRIELEQAYLRAASGASNATLEYAEAQRELNRAVDAGAVSAEEAIDITRRNRIELLESQRTAEAGAERAFLKFTDDALNAAAQTEELFTNTFNSLSDELFNFVKTGEFNFNSLVQTIIDGLIKIAIQQAIGGAFGLAGGGIGGTSGAPGGSAGGIGGFVASALLGANDGAQFTVGAGTSQGTLPGVDNRLVAFRARDGEEVTVTPRSQGAGSMGGPINIVQNIQTKDADSFKRSESQQAVRASAVLSRARRRM